jgi:hypothetical protein
MNSGRHAAGHRRWRKLGLGATVAALLTGMFVVVTVSHSVGASASDDLANVDPAALVAPAAPAPVVMNCLAGQTDLNHATLAQLQQLPTPDGSVLSSSVASNIVSGRPYLQPTDLRAPAVNGVTDNHVALWRKRGLVCTLPIFVNASDGTAVPVAPDVCTSPSQADLNDSQQRAKFAALFGDPTATRIVAGAPYPSVVNALRRAGVGPGGLKQSAGKVCVTPYPIESAGIDWAFAKPGTGVAVTAQGHFGAYTLIVPAGAATGTGEWASVTETAAQISQQAGISSFTLDTPTVNGHIHGDFTGPVGVTLPPDPADVGQGAGDIAIHYSSVSGPMVHMGDAVAHTPDGRLSIAVDDLSLVSSLHVLIDAWDVVRRLMPLQEASEYLVRTLLGAGGTTSSCDPDYTGQTLAAGEKLDMDSELFSALPGQFSVPMTHCATRLPGATKLDGEFGNNRGTVMGVDAYQSVGIDDISSEGGLLTTIATNLWNGWAIDNDRRLILNPGSKLHAHPNLWQGSFKIDTGLDYTLPPTILYLITENLSTFLPPALGALLDEGDCLFNAVKGVTSLGWNAGLPIEVTDMVKDAIGCLAGWVKEHGATGLATLWFGPDVTVGQAMDTSVLARRLGRIALWLKIGQAALAATDALSLAAYDGTVNLRWRAPEPSNPTDDNGRALVSWCFTKTFSYDAGWVFRIDQTCQDIAYGDYSSVSGPGPACSAESPLENAFDDWDGAVHSCRLYNVLLRSSAGVLHLVKLEDGKLVAHPIAKDDEASFKEDWPEWEWRSNEFSSSVDAIGDPAVNDPLVLRDFTHGRGGNWLLRQSDGQAWWVDGNGNRTALGHDATAQQAVAKSVLTLDPAQWAGDICPYNDPNQGSDLKVC